MFIFNLRVFFRKKGRLKMFKIFENTFHIQLSHNILHVIHYSHYTVTKIVKKKIILLTGNKRK